MQGISTSAESKVEQSKNKKKKKKNITAETDIEKLEGTKTEVKEERKRNHLEHLPPSPKEQICSCNSPMSIFL
jgi:hypothetical protein